MNLTAAPQALAIFLNNHHCQEKSLCATVRGGLGAHLVREERFSPALCHSITPTQTQAAREEKHPLLSCQKQGMKAGKDLRVLVYVRTRY